MNKSSITFLGTGGDINVVGKQIRAGNGIILNLEGNQFLLEPGPGCLSSAKRFGVNLRETIAIIATNNDLMLCNDINVAVAAMTIDGADRTGVLIGAKSIIESEKSILLEQYKNMVEKAIAIHPEMKIGINEIDIHAIPTKTPDESGVALKFVTSNFTIGYTGCTELFPELIEKLKGSDILIVNCKNPGGAREPGQMDADATIELAKAVQPKLILLTFFGKKMLDENPIAQARDIKLATNIQAVSAGDGTTIDPANYSAKRNAYNWDLSKEE